MPAPNAFQLRQPIGGDAASPFHPGGKAVEFPCAATDASSAANKTGFIAECIAHSVVHEQSSQLAVCAG